MENYRNLNIRILNYVWLYRSREKYNIYMSSRFLSTKSKLVHIYFIEKIIALFVIIVYAFNYSFITLHDYAKFKMYYIIFYTYKLYVPKTLRPHLLKIVRVKCI